MMRKKGKDEDDVETSVKSGLICIIFVLVNCSLANRNIVRI